MKLYKNSSLIIIIILSVFFHINLAAQNIKVFILAGQSNMQGHGDVTPANVSGTLSHFMANGGHTEFGYIQEADGSWTTRNDVWVRYDKADDINDEDLLTGVLNIGFGSADFQIGPELGFGHQLGEYSNDKILIIKTCWGGRSLVEDFRPPSSGGTVGPFYTRMISDINQAINNIATEFPDYNNETIEIAGFTWFQGWNDGEEQSFLAEYEQNLIHLIADVRSDLNTPNLPVVVGLTGNGGWAGQLFGGYIGDLQSILVPAQINAANFTGHTNVCYAETRDFWKGPVASPDPGAEHHWRNNAESYLRIGNEFGLKMIELLDGNCTNTDISTVSEGSGYGFNYFTKEAVPSNNFGAGYSFYSAVWPFMEAYPGAINFQVGQGTWAWPLNNGALPENFYNTIEGGLGWWGDTRFGMDVPKFIMGGVAFDFRAFANGPGAGSTDYINGGFRDGERDWSIPGGKYGAVQLSSNLLWPPDGLNMDGNMNGEFLGYGYHPLPLTDPLTTTFGTNFETGNQCWTLFMNTSNFKGPVAFFMPNFWNSVVLNEDPNTFEGIFLDSRPSNPDLSFAQEFSAAPSIVGEDDNGNVYAQTLPPVYPKTTSNSSEVMRDINVYSRNAKWDEVESWFNGGPVPATLMNPSGSLPVDFEIDNNDPGAVNAAIWTGAGPQVDTFIDQSSYTAIKTTTDKKAAYFEWDTNVVDDIGTGFRMPEFYQLTNNEWNPIPMANVPASTGLLDHEPLTNPIDEDYAYVTPLETDCHFFGQPSPWTNPGPVAGPFTVSLGDGSELTYYWYRFIDQPAVIHADLPAAMRQNLQARVELIHTHWKHTDNYLPNPTGGSLASLDQNLIVTPPAGFEIGYVPIVSRQEYVGIMTTTTNVSDMTVDQNSIQLYPNPVVGEFTIEGNFQNYSIQILSQNGTVYQNLTGNASPITIDITSLPQGIYFIRVFNTTNNQVSFEKILKL